MSFKLFTIRIFLPIQMIKNTNAQNMAPHHLLNSEQFVSKMNQITQRNKMNKNTNEQNYTPHRLLNLSQFGIHACICHYLLFMHSM